ncbi:MAG: GTP-binding protein [Eubacteriales bacterium]|nr:GTP-binding protein [Eubacteriales bacterium]
MVKVNIISGFLGAGKTTLIKKLLGGAMKDEQVILLENEYGEVGIDGGFMKDSGIKVTEMNSGCICCTLVGDFTKAIDELIEKYHPDRLIIEPSGVGKLSDIRHVVAQAEKKHELVLSGCVTVVDAGKCKMYMKNFGEFFCDQVRSAETIILSRTQMTSQDKIDADIAMLREQNPAARIITTPWDDLTADVILKTIESPEALINVDEIYEEHHHDDDEDEHEHHHHHHHHDGEECDDPECECHHHHDGDDDDDDHDEHEHHHHHDDDDDDHECCCGHHHDDDDDHDEHEHHHHHDHDDDEDEHEHHHHHHDHECGCGHHHHHADEVFENIGVETSHKFEETALREMLKKLGNSGIYGDILRAKGILPTPDGAWLHFDYTPGEWEIRHGSADYTGRLCVIGCHINEDKLRELFGV